MKKIKKWLFMSLLVCVTTIHTRGNIHRSHLRGWYPTEKTVLIRMLQEFDAYAQAHYDAPLYDARAIIVPHAGYRYSGKLAASAFRFFDKKKIKKVIILAPSHTHFFTGLATLTSSGYQIPNGTVRLDKPRIKKLLTFSFIHNDDDVGMKDFLFNHEHSLEITLPMVQFYLPNAKIIPFIVGTINTKKEVQEIADALYSEWDESTALVVSSDFTHYGQSYNFVPFKDHIKERIRQLDSSILRHILTPSLDRLWSFFHETNTTVCGKFPLMILTALFEKDSLQKYTPFLVSYATSADDQEVIAKSVSYSGVVYGREQAAVITPLTAYEQQALLTLARQSVENSFTKRVPQKLLLPVATPRLSEKRGAFVTLMHKDGSLRGCIGSVTTPFSLMQTVSKRAYDAAFKDTRFDPVQEHELKDIIFKLSILTDSTPLRNYKDIVLGKHGVILEYHGKRSLFLPSVAIEHKWDHTTLLEQLSLKAGLSKQAWKQARLLVFETIDSVEKDNS